MAYSFNLILLLSLAIGTSALLQQSVGCKGKLLCGSTPAAGVRVALWVWLLRDPTF